MAAPSVFISYSHRDQVVARRLGRALAAHGIDVWRDEDRLRLGATLTPALRARIAECDVVIVVASTQSAASAWVEDEIATARTHGKGIVPLFLEPLDRHERFRAHMGIAAIPPHSFADAVHRIVIDLWAGADAPAPDADRERLDAGLRTLAQEQPSLAPLILGCLDGAGLHKDTLETAWGTEFHALDEAVHALWAFMPSEHIAHHAAVAFRRTGAGTRALAAWVQRSGDGGLPLALAVGDALPPALVPAAIALLGACTTPNNQALYGFIAANAAQFDDAARRATIRLATWPVRTDTRAFGDVLGWVALRHLRGAAEIPQQWARWIAGGSFDGTPNRPGELARYLRDARAEELEGVEVLEEALRSHVRAAARSRDERRVRLALRHLMAAADEEAPVLGLLRTEVGAAPHTAEWDAWAARDPDTAARMGWEVHAIVEAAYGERDWLAAKRRATLLAADERAGHDAPDADPRADAPA